ncbi:MAG TPA: multicopper oxidase domain-containing protein [Bryobacteraceae bacterium]|nr:multicopper oxidase domain-containing protein [Bryobacteraceae bacterium]
MSSRRTFLKTGAGAIGGLMLSRDGANAQGPPPSPPVTPFMDPLPIPGTHHPVGLGNLPVRAGGAPARGPHYEVPMVEILQKLHSQLPPTRLWGYSGSYPGPSFEVRRGQPISVRFTNNLPNHHLLSYAIDPTLHGSQPGTPEVRTVVHLHGGRVLPESDGHPDAWFTPGFAQKGPRFASEVFLYPNDQPATMLWYHDHTIGITRLNVFAGLAGLYIIRDPEEQSSGLPQDRFEIPLVIQDRHLNPDGSLGYPPFGLSPQHPIWMPDFFGDLALVNGKVMPFLEVEPRAYRFRVLNGSNSRFLNLHLDSGTPFIQLGADLGFLPAPTVMQSLLLSPAERADVVIDFSRLAGREIVMTNDAPTPFGPPSPFPGPPLPLIMKFRVRSRNGNSSNFDAGRLRLPAPAPLSLSSVAQTRDILLTEEVNQFGVPLVTKVEDKMWFEPVSTFPKAGSTEIWRFINAIVFAHPMHVHLARMQVLDRQQFNVGAFMQTGAVVPTGPAVPAAPNEVNAPKDTVIVEHGGMTRVLVNFELPSGTTVSPGQHFPYVHHCHILEHEDNEMMRPYEVVG